MKTIEYTERGILLPPEIDDVTRREFLIGAGLVVLVTACGGEEGDESSGKKRSFKDGRGTVVDVPAEPKRIVAVHDSNGGVQVLSLGFSLAGMPYRTGRFDPTIAEFYDLEGVEPVGEVYAPNLETIAALGPDLIVGEAYQGEATLEPGVVDSLEEIAPTVFMDTFRPVEEVMEDFGELLGARRKEEDQQAAYNESIDGLRRELSVAPEEITVSFIQFRDGNNIFAYGKTLTPLHNALTEIGFTWTETIDKAEPDASIQLTLENISDLDGDVIFWDPLNDAGEGRASNARVEEIRDKPLFQKLAGVQAGQAFLLPENLSGGNCYETYERIFDYLEGVFLENEIDPNVLPGSKRQRKERT
jgi:iron complex transport system substrate-binding protein